MSSYIADLNANGYVVIPNILDPDEVAAAYTEFHRWEKTLDLKPGHTIHGIFKFHGVGNARHAWLIRTNPKVQAVFKELWKTDELVVSMDGACHYPPVAHGRDGGWTHTDQSSNKVGRFCVQGFVALTSNSERTLIVYEGSHLLHEQYFKDKGEEAPKDWNLIDLDYLAKIQDKKRYLDVPAGSLVLWDSRSFHQNSNKGDKERLVQYVCYLPKKNPANSAAMIKKRAKYFETQRTTSHWPYKIKVNGLQPRTYGKPELLIDYDRLAKPELTDMMTEILRIL